MCVLHVTSDNDSMSEFISKVGLPVYMVHDRGDLISSNPQAGIYEDSGFSCTVSEKGYDDLQGQIEDAISFLQQYEQSFIGLIARYHIIDIRLDFPMTSRIATRPTCFSQCDYLPPELLRLAGCLGIGIEISQYRGDRNEDVDRIIQEMEEAND